VTFEPRNGLAVSLTVPSAGVGLSGRQAHANLPPRTVSQASPHAGYIYSGRVAAAGYRRLALVREGITRVVLLGPSHFVGFHGLAAASADGWQTPLAACRSTALWPCA
jgi:AmmeMemoRadiSam system protein B